MSCVILFVVLGVAHGEDLAKIDEALPLDANITAFYPIFDFDGDSCLPSAAFSRKGKMNHGLKTSGSMTGMCRSDNFMALSNTYHRHLCTKDSVTIYCGHSFALYFLKDQSSGFGEGHRHDWQKVIVWTENGAATHGSYSASCCSGGFKTTTIYSLPTMSHGQLGHPTFVYHKEFLMMHALRPAKHREEAENKYKMFVTPTIASWFTMKGDGISNRELRTKIAGMDFGNETTIPHLDLSFLATINDNKPKAFPNFPRSCLATPHNQ